MVILKLIFKLFLFKKKKKGYILILNEIIFLGVDLFKENLIIGFILKNDLIKDGVLFNKSSSVPLSKISLESFDNVLKKIWNQNLKME